MQFWKALTGKLYCLYFILLWGIIGIGHLISGKTGLGYLFNFALCLPFIYQMLYEKKYLNILLGCAMLFWSIWIFFAYLSDVFNPNSRDLETWRGFLFGGLLVVMNLIISIQLIRRSNDKGNRQAVHHQPV